MQRWTIDFNGSSYSRDCRKCYKILYLLSFCHYSSSRWMYFFFVFIRIACLFSFQLLEFLLYIYLHVSMWRFFFSFVSFVPNDWCYVHGSEALTRSYIFASHMCALHACMCTFQSAKSFYANSTSWVYSSAIPPLFFFLLLLLLLSRHGLWIWFFFASIFVSLSCFSVLCSQLFVRIEVYPHSAIQCVYEFANFTFHKQLE